MSTRLFRAVVGLGISLGTASSACFGAVSDEDPKVTPDTGAPSVAPPPVASDAGVVPPPPTADAAPAPEDASADALLDAFCDASWPTTKGNPSGPTCGTTDDCSDAGPAPRCFVQSSPGTCDSEPLAVAWCVGGAWQCSAQAVPIAECACWVGTACP